MDESYVNLPAGAVTLGAERALRMAVPVSPAPLIDLPLRCSAMPAYAALVRLDWRRDEPLANVAAMASA